MHESRQLIIIKIQGIRNIAGGRRIRADARIAVWIPDFDDRSNPMDRVKD